jgi:hypothetical protein
MRVSDGVGHQPVRAVVGAAIGLSVWLVLSLQLIPLPGAVAFYIGAVALIFGCGALPLLAVAPEIPTAERTALACALGLTLSPALLLVFSVARCGFLFPPLAFAATGAAAALWRRVASPPSRDARWYIVLPAVVFALTAWVSAGRMTVTDSGLSIYGNYDTLDLTYYAAISTQLGHTTGIPPASPFYAGHRIIYSYFALALLSAIHKVSGVPTLQAFLWYGWPLFTSVAAATVFALCRRLGSAPFAATASLLVFTGSGLSYLVAWWSPSMVEGDPLIWASVFMAPSAEWLFFNPWAPTLSVVILLLYAVGRLDEPGALRWGVIASLCCGSLFMFKSFAFGIVVPALGIAAVISFLRRDRTWLRLASVAIGGVAYAAPWLMAVLPYNRLENRGALLSIEYLTLVRRMLVKMHATDALERAVQAVVGPDRNFRILLTVASIVFLIGGLGTRCLGLWPVLQAAGGRRSMRQWTVLAWVVILGIATPFVVSIAPFPNSIQTYEFGLFALWPFTAMVVWRDGVSVTPTRLIATAALALCSIPATAHYAWATHTASRGPALTGLGTGDLRIVRNLRGSDPDSTMILHGAPLYPSLYGVESERRVVLAWSSYVSGDENPDVDALSSDIAAFFGSPTGVGVESTDLFRRYGVTHIIVRASADRVHPAILSQLRLVTGSPEVQLYEVPVSLRR